VIGVPDAYLTMGIHCETIPVNDVDYMKSSFVAVILLVLQSFSGAAEKPNILFIMTDQHFADVLSQVMGKDYIHTPHLDKLAASGLRFDRAYAPNPICKPARNSIFSGYYPFETGIQINENKPLPERMISMGVRFRNAGYETGYFGKWHLNISTKDKNRHGFNSMGVLKGNGGDHLIPMPSIEFLKRNREKPFLLVTSFTSPHDICQLCRGEEIPGGPIGDLPAAEQCPPAPINLGPTRDETDTMAIMRRSYYNTRTFPVGDFTADKWRQMRWGYYRLVERADAHIGKVLTTLTDLGLEKNTLIIFTADHGDCTGAHSFAQKTVFYDESSRIPFIVSFKGKIKPGKTDKLVNVGIDTLPTMMDFAGIEIPEELKGRSVKPVTENPVLEDWRKYIIVSNHMAQGGRVDSIQGIPHPRGRMVRTENFKYAIYDMGEHRESLIDMSRDPYEMQNLARNSQYSEVLKMHRKILKTFAKENDDRVALEIIEGKLSTRQPKRSSRELESNK